MRYLSILLILLVLSCGEISEDEMMQGSMPTAPPPEMDDSLFFGKPKLCNRTPLNFFSGNLLNDCDTSCFAPRKHSGTYIGNVYSPPLTNAIKTLCDDTQSSIMEGEYIFFNQSVNGTVYQIISALNQSPEVIVHFNAGSPNFFLWDWSCKDRDCDFITFAKDVDSEFMKPFVSFFDMEGDKIFKRIRMKVESLWLGENDYTVRVFLFDFDLSEFTKVYEHQFKDRVLDCDFDFGASNRFEFFLSEDVDPPLLDGMGFNNLKLRVWNKDNAGFEIGTDWDKGYCVRNPFSNGLHYKAEVFEPIIDWRIRNICCE